jgi:hypothetical protein
MPSNNPRSLDKDKALLKLVLHAATLVSSGVRGELTQGATTLESITLNLQQSIHKPSNLYEHRHVLTLGANYVSNRSFNSINPHKTHCQLLAKKLEEYLRNCIAVEALPKEEK